MNLANLLIGLIVAAIVYLVAATFLAAPIPLLLALLVLVVVIFGGLDGGTWLRR